MDKFLERALQTEAQNRIFFYNGHTVFLSLGLPGQAKGVLCIHRG